MSLIPKIFPCQHIRTNGVPCSSPALRKRPFCYYHNRTSRRPNPRPTGLPLLEDGNAIQFGIAEVIRRILLCDIDTKAAGLLLYAYQIASNNLDNVHLQPSWNDVVLNDPIEEAEEADRLRNQTENKMLLEAGRDQKKSAERVWPPHITLEAGKKG